MCIRDRPASLPVVPLPVAEHAAYQYAVQSLAELHLHGGTEEIPLPGQGGFFLSLIHIYKLYARDYALGATVTASQTRGNDKKFAPSTMTDGEAVHFRRFV